MRCSESITDPGYRRLCYCNMKYPTGQIVGWIFVGAAAIILIVFLAYLIDACRHPVMAFDTTIPQEFLEHNRRIAKQKSLRRKAKSRASPRDTAARGFRPSPSSPTAARTPHADRLMPSKSAGAYGGLHGKSFNAPMQRAPSGLGLAPSSHPFQPAASARTMRAPKHAPGKFFT